MPVLMAPMGSLHRFSPRGSLDVDDASEEFGTVNFLSTVTEPGLEEVAENTLGGLKLWAFSRLLLPFFSY